MRFRKLQIPAFGPFTELELRFADSPSDFHLVYGANEAGKSSLLRAIGDLLFGIHSQTKDNFLHSHTALRIRGEIQNREGKQLFFQRRKGIRNTLLDGSDHPLSDDALLPFVGAVDEAYFSAMFGLGGRELREGAEALLRGEGDVGLALFSASMGGTPVQKVVETLRQEYEKLYKGRSTANVVLRPTATRYKDLIRQSREAAVSAEVWESLEAELDEAETKKKQLDDELSKLELEIGWFSRCEDAFPAVARLAEAEQKRKQLPAVPELASDFPKRTQAAREKVRQAKTEVERLAAAAARLKEQLQACATTPAVLARAEILNELHQDLGAYREQKKDLAQVEAALAALGPQIRTTMRSLELACEIDELENHRLASATRLACEEAANRLKEALQAQSANQKRIEEFQARMAELTAELPDQPAADLAALREALDVAAHTTEADRDLPVSRAEVQRLTRETRSLHQQVHGAPEDLDSTEKLPVPASTTIRLYREDLDRLGRDMEQAREELRDAGKTVAAIETHLARMQRQRELPSEETLREARARRDRGWSLVHADWKGRGTQEEFVPGVPLEQAFPEAMLKADEIADRLRIEAEAVAQAEEKRQQLAQASTERTAAQARITRLEAALAERQRAWALEWSSCAIQPRSAIEMEEWRERWNRFCASLANLRTAEDNHARKVEQVKLARERLAKVLGDSPDKEFSILFQAARIRVQQGEGAAGQRRQINGQVKRLNADIERLEQNRAGLAGAVETAATQWRAQCDAVGVAAATSPETALALLSERRQLLDKFDRWRELSAQSRQLSALITQYEKSVREESAMLGVAAETIEGREAALWKALSESRQAQTRHDQLVENERDAVQQFEHARGELAAATEALKELLQLSGMETEEDLERLLAQIEQHGIVQTQIENLRNALSGVARGQPLDEFVAAVSAESPDLMASKRAAAARIKQEKKQAQDCLVETVFRLREGRQALEKAGGNAAALRQEAEICGASLRQHAQRFLRLRLATDLLQRQIEQFRKQNQGPLLERSGQVFASITRGAFSGLGADFSQNDVPVLVGVRPDQTKIPIHAMSDGSRDQLFLALRLAALERHIEEHEPMPLILDDLLITFDDQRVKAILPHLHALAKRTQIFLFTHHRHLVELCREVLGHAEFHLHDLPHGNSTPLRPHTPLIFSSEGTTRE